MKPCYTLNIDISNALKQDFNFKKLYDESPFSREKMGMWFFRKDKLPELFNTTWLEHMKSLDVEVGSCIVFYRESNYYRDEAHVDLFESESDSIVPAIYALNWILNPDDDSEMIWYEYPDVPPEIKRTTKTPYMRWELKDVADKEIFRHTIGNQLTLVNVGIPHNIQTKKSERWCISLRLKNKMLKDWDHTVESFSEFIC